MINRLDLILIVLLLQLVISCNNQSDYDDVLTKDTLTSDQNVFLQPKESIELLPDSISDVLDPLGLCLKDALKEDIIGDNYYYYCDTNYFHVYKISSDLSWQDAFLVEIKKNTGTGGWHYFVFKKEDDQYKKLNFFQGWLGDLKKNKKGYYDIIFTVSGNTWERIKLLLSMDENNYKFKKVLQVTNVDPDRDTTLIIKDYNKGYNDPKFWKFMSEME